jgi:LuxR family quorum sensing-dependent transcriptional regulator
MHRKLQLFDFTSALKNARNARAAWEILNSRIYNLGFSGATYAISSGLRGKSVSEEIRGFSSYHPDFIAAYADNSFADHDYAVRHGSKRGKPTLWSHIKEPNPTKGSRLFQECANDFGLSDGIVIPFHDPSSTIISGMGVSLAKNSTGCDVSALRNWDTLLMACAAFDEFMRKPKSVCEVFNLSAREVECIRLVCFGKVHKEIADDLNLADKTVEHYLANAARKLNCRNKHHLAAKATLFGLFTI